MPSAFFSIIIPTHNTARYLPACIESVLAQTFSDFEVILVDDASTDETAELADRLAFENEQIHVLHIPHGGPSAARNAGLGKAQGKYVIFVDSDDMLVSNALERIREELSDTTDMLWFNFLYLMEDGSTHEGKELAACCYANAAEATSDWIRNNMLPRSACNKAFRLSIIRESGIAFREGIDFGEDRFFNIDYLKHCGQIVIIPDALYIYRVLEGSGSHRFVPGMLSILSDLHEERASGLLPLAAEALSPAEQEAFLQTDFEKSLKSSWHHLAQHYPTLSAQQRDEELRAFLDMDMKERFDSITPKTQIPSWLVALNAANRIGSLTMLKLMMLVTRRASKSAAR